MTLRNRGCALAVTALLAACDGDQPAHTTAPTARGLVTAPSAAPLPYADARLPDPADYADAAAGEIDRDNYERRLDEIDEELDEQERASTSTGAGRTGAPAP
jgi:hypothetical protein